MHHLDQITLAQGEPLGYPRELDYTFQSSLAPNNLCALQLLCPSHLLLPHFPLLHP